MQKVKQVYLSNCLEINTVMVMFPGEEDEDWLASLDDHVVMFSPEVLLLVSPPRSSCSYSWWISHCLVTNIYTGNNH